jgi:hypothetical protein
LLNVQAGPRNVIAIHDTNTTCGHW